MTSADTVCPECGKTFKTAGAVGGHRVHAHGYRSAHGTFSRYTNSGCRCEACTAANTERVRNYMHRTGRKTPMDVYRAEQLSRSQKSDGEVR